MCMGGGTGPKWDCWSHRLTGVKDKRDGRKNRWWPNLSVTNTSQHTNGRRHVTTWGLAHKLRAQRSQPLALLIVEQSMA